MDHVNLHREQIQEEQLISPIDKYKDRQSWFGVCQKYFDYL